MSMQISRTVHHEEDTPLDVFNYNVKKLQEAKTQTIVVLSADMLSGAGRTISDFEQALARPHYVHHADHLRAYVVGVNCSDEQFQHAIKFYASQEASTSAAMLKRFRKAWKATADSNGGVVGMGFFTFLLPPCGLTAETFVAQLKPAPVFSKIAAYVHPSGLNDEILLLATDQQKLDELEFKTRLTHVSKVHELVGVVLSVADPEAKGRAQIRVQFLQDNVDDAALPWVGVHELNNSMLTNGQPHFPVPLVGSRVRVFLTWNNDGGYVVTYGQMLAM